MIMSIQPQDARLIIASRLRELAAFIEDYYSSPILPENIKGRLKLINDYADAFYTSHLSIGVSIGDGS